MPCPHPISIRDDTGQLRVVPCGKCIHCLNRKRNDWAIRLENELRVSTTAYFVTLTYDDRNCPVGDDVLTLDKRDVQLFMKKLRKAHKNAILRYYLVGEYGTSTQRPHYHLILFNLPYSDKMKVYKSIEDSWQKGQIDVGDVTPSSIAYVTKYMIQNVEEFEGREKPFALMSRRPGIGANYKDTHKKYHQQDTERVYVTSEGGIKRALPRYYREAFYNKFTREVQAAKAARSSDADFQARKERYEKLYNKRYEYYENEQREDFERRLKRKLKENRKKI